MKPIKTLHPALQARAVAVKAAHAHLTQTMPGFRNLPGREQIKHTQAHATKTMKAGGC